MWQGTYYKRNRSHLHTWRVTNQHELNIQRNWYCTKFQCWVIGCTWPLELALFPGSPGTRICNVRVPERGSLGTRLLGVGLGLGWGEGRGRGRGVHSGLAQVLQPICLKLDGAYPGNSVWYQLSAHIAGRLFCVLYRYLNTTVKSQILSCYIVLHCVT